MMEIVTEQTLEQRWERRSNAFKKATPQFQKSQRRFLTLLRFEHPLDVLTEIAPHMGWTWSTVCTYAGTILSTKATVEIPLTQADRKGYKALEKEAMKEEPQAAPPLLRASPPALPPGNGSRILR